MAQQPVVKVHGTMMPLNGIVLDKDNVPVNPTENMFFVISGNPCYYGRRTPGGDLEWIPLFEGIAIDALTTQVNSLTQALNQANQTIVTMQQTVATMQSDFNAAIDSIAATFNSMTTTLNT